MPLKFSLSELVQDIVVDIELPLVASEGRGQIIARPVHKLAETASILVIKAAHEVVLDVLPRRLNEPDQSMLLRSQLQPDATAISGITHSLRHLRDGAMTEFG